MGRGTLGFAARQTARVEREGGRGLRWEPAGLRGEQGEGGLRVRERVAMAVGLFQSERQDGVLPGLELKWISLFFFCGLKPHFSI
jgi:hypothetical protein